VQAFQSCSVQTSATWGLDRISEVALNLDERYVYPTGAGVGVTAYIVDTGIEITHPDFQDRAEWGANFADQDNTDCNGHGTHVAGTVAGQTYGVAKGANLVAVKVLDCSGSGTWEGVVSGIQYVASEHKKRKTASVANMSLGGGKAQVVNDAVTAAIAAGVTFAVAAGNNDGEACLVSPASTPTAITVGATTVANVNGQQIDDRAYFSNYGTCVTLLAPGQMIASDWLDGTVKVISGTSMASPHVAGAAAAYLSANLAATPAQVKAYLSQQATEDVIQLSCLTTETVCKQTPNLLLYSPCAGARTLV